MYLLLREAMSIVGFASRGPLPLFDSEKNELGCGTEEASKALRKSTCKASWHHARAQCQLHAGKAMTSSSSFSITLTVCFITKLECWWYLRSSKRPNGLQQSKYMPHGERKEKCTDYVIKSNCLQLKNFWPNMVTTWTFEVERERCLQRVWNGLQGHWKGKVVEIGMDPTCEPYLCNEVRTN